MSFIQTATCGLVGCNAKDMIFSPNEKFDTIKSRFQSQIINNPAKQPDAIRFSLIGWNEQAQGVLECCLRTYFTV